MTDTPSHLSSPPETQSCCSARHHAAGQDVPLIKVPEALDLLKVMVRPILEQQSRPLGKALGHVLAQALTSHVPLPINDNSAVDGYAIRLSALKQAPLDHDMRSLPIAGRIAAGNDISHIPSDAVCVRILTGASVPVWADSIIMQEDTQLSEDGNFASFSELPTQGSNIRRQGEDVPQRSVIIEKGARIDTRHIAIAAASGNAQLPVVRPIRVALLATGSELNHPGADLPPGGIYDSNTPMLTALLSRANIDLTIHHMVQDKFETIRDTLSHLAENNDLLVTSGGMSVSDEDYIHRAITAISGTFEVHKLRLKPGKPLGFGKVKNCVFIGLPGNPFAALVGFLLFGTAALDALAGISSKPAPMQGEADFTTPNGGTRLEFVPVRISGTSENGLPKLDKIGRGGSARLRPLIEADGLAALPIANQGIAKGDRLDFYEFHCAFELG
ncbi:molybdopterin molybdotransferase MoeA [Cohaesibacter celericrescens]|uniref:Molybdopterin molybdenumtransferase n=1 Tax=Cohaesibacter celericrescens TaxID=2067669 RepID=A0A2N5XS57_9HYPH|nr:molybdopterin molybdotransferase MoeA [Cohaesibacter celericrescens]PLW77329.1 molybdopterin molybdenumtransferase MoeA [Cohaesibacter celericrescens]